MSFLESEFGGEMLLPTALTGAWDEMRGADGTPRPEWQDLMAAMGELGADELTRRVENGRRTLREHGVTCFVGDASGERDVPWDLDFLPFVIGPGEWRELAAGLTQRARLLNQVLADLHGQQRLVRDGLVPGPLLYANPSYLRACQAVPPPSGVYLHTYAADLARAPDGRWWVVADRTQAPAGLGFALENRSVLSRVLPEVVQRLRPQSLHDALRRRRLALRRLAPQATGNPAIALLTPGPRYEAYYEHAYLARLQGFTLVEGGDLTVRERRVFLKTLEGLRPVEVILRCVADGFCDPLELRSESLLGVPGLVEATRAGNVSVANALGSGIAESPAFMPFLPALCRHLLGEEPRLPSLATWWCGQVREWEYARDHLDGLVLRPAFRGGAKPIVTAGLSGAERDRLLADFRARAHEFVVQERVMLSRAPAHDGSSHPVTLRMFAVFDGHDYTVLPGGLARLMPDETVFAAPALLAGRSKDVWVLPEEPGGQGPISVPVTTAPALERAPSDLPSRVAENYYWLGRNVERLEATLRVCGGVIWHLTNESSAARSAALLGYLGRLEVGPAETPGNDHSLPDLQTIVMAELTDPSAPTGVQPALRRIRETAFSLRDRLSADTWRVLIGMTAAPDIRTGQLPLVHAADAVNSLIMQIMAFSGLEMENMTRGHGWVFLDLGRRLERGAALARLVRAVCEAGEHRELLLEPLLEIADSVMTYRRRYFAEPQLPGVLNLLLHEPTNPRSLTFQLAALARLAASLPATANPEGVALFRQRLQVLQTSLEDGFMAGAAPDLEGVERELGALSDVLTHIFFSHVVPQVN